MLGVREQLRVPRPTRSTITDIRTSSTRYNDNVEDKGPKKFAYTRSKRVLNGSMGSCDKLETFTSNICGYEAPVLGRYRSFFNPSLKGKHQSKSKKIGPLPRENAVKAIQKLYSTSRSPSGLFGPPPSARDGPYLGPHNMMWDPHVRRGTAIVHFSQLEKKCGSSSTFGKKEKKKAEGTRAAIKEMYSVKGTVLYPDVVLKMKQEHTDYSLFLEEQDVVEPEVKDAETQSGVTWGDICKGEPERYTDEIRSGECEELDEQMERCAGVKNYRIGMDVSTQVGRFDLAKDLHAHAPNPSQHTINTLAMIFANQLLAQSILEQMESNEIDELGRQRTELEFWFATNALRNHKEERALCKKIARMEMEEEMEEDLEWEMEHAKRHLTKGMLSRCLIEELLTKCFEEALDQGLLETEVEGNEMNRWMERVLCDVVLNNEGVVVHGLVDDLLHSASRQRIAAAATADAAEAHARKSLVKDEDELPKNPDPSEEEVEEEEGSSEFVEESEDQLWSGPSQIEEAEEVPELKGYEYKEIEGETGSPPVERLWGPHF